MYLHKIVKLLLPCSKLVLIEKLDADKYVSFFTVTITQSNVASSAQKFDGKSEIDDTL